MKKIILFFLALALSTLCAYAQSSFDSRFEDAKNYYMRGEYKTAVETLQRALSIQNLSAVQKEQATRLINQCRQEIEAAKRLTLGRKNFDNLPYTSIADSTYINVQSKKAWHIVSSPEWVTYSNKGDMIYFYIHENPTHEVRSGFLEITLDKTSTTYIHFEQNGRPLINKKLNITTDPGAVQVSVDGDMLPPTPTSVSLRPGSHRLRFLRQNYEPMDTTIVINDDLNKDDIDLSIRLKRQFATLLLSLVPEDGNERLMSSPSLSIDGKSVDLRPKVYGYYHEIKPIEFYTLYSDGSIPVHGGSHVINITAPGYDDIEYDLLKAADDSTYTLTFTMLPKAGYLNITNLFDADGAEIYIDGKLQKGKFVPCDSLKVATGQHVVTFRKEGMISASESYSVEIEEKAVSTLGVSMVGCDTYVFANSLPINADVYIDSLEVGKTPLTTILSKGTHHVLIKKVGYLPIVDRVNVKGVNETINYEGVMPETAPFRISADENHLRITISQNGSTIISDAETPAVVHIPVSDKNYRIILKRDNKTLVKTAYRGSFKFKDPEKNHLDIQSWSKNIFHILEAGYYLDNNPINIYGKDYKSMADVDLFKFQLIRGLSTSVAKSRLFVASDNKDMLVENDVELKGDHFKVLPAVSFVLVNAEFRLGGALFKYMDANLLGAYTWYPDFTKWFPSARFNHVSGHNVFAGVEFASRFPVATVTFKVGYEMLMNGFANIYDINPDSFNKNQLRKSPMDYNKITFGVSVSLGPIGSKGNNILRIF